MKIVFRIVLGIILSLILLIVGIWFYSRWYHLQESDVTAQNKNITLIGESKAGYNADATYQNTDGSILLISSLRKSAIFSNRQVNAISLILIGQNAQPVWESILDLHQRHWSDILPFVLPKYKVYQNVRVLCASKMDNQYKILVSRSVQDRAEILILSVDAKGKLVALQTANVKFSTPSPNLAGQADSRLSIVMRNIARNERAACTAKTAYLTYKDTVNKLLCLSIIDWKTAKVSYTAMLSIPQDSLKINAIAVDSAGKFVSIAAHDTKVGQSYYMYDPVGDLKEYFRSDKKTRIDALHYRDGSLYALVKDDSLLSVTDLTSISHPVNILSCHLPYKWFSPADLQIVNGSYHILLNFRNPDYPNWSGDAAVLRFDAKGRQTGEFLMQGKRYDFAQALCKRSDNQLLAFGYTASHKLDVGTRAFISRVKIP